MSDQTKSLYLQLAESVGPMAHLPNNGASYHTGEQIITHLNRVLGPENWSFRVLEMGEEADSDECWCFGEITATIGGVTVVKQDYGSQAFKRARSTGKYISKWDDKKSAATDALKRAARLLGVGLDAWANEKAPSWRPESVDDPDERREVAAEMAAAKRAPLGAATNAAKGAPGTPASRSASTPTASAATPTSSSTRATVAPTTEEVDRAARMTGAPPKPETTQERWQRLVAEAEAANVETIGRVKAIDPKAVTEAQLRKYADQLEERLKGVRAA